MPHTPQQEVFPPKPKGKVYTPLMPQRPTPQNPSPPVPEVEETTVVKPRRKPKLESTE